MSVYTVVNQAELEVFLADYEQGALVAFEGISAGIENTNYFVDTTTGRFVLTIFEHHRFEELPYFLNIMAFMADHQIPTAHPKPTLNGHYLKALKGKPAALVERLTGSGVEHPTRTQCEIMAKNLAKFHLAGQDYQQTRANDRDLHWMQKTFQSIKSYLSKDEIDLIAIELAYQADIAWDTLPESEIHADLFCDNALFNGDVLSGIIDLYYACNAPMLYDLAVMVNDWCRTEQGGLNTDMVKAVLNAYEAVRPLTMKEQSFWKPALRLAALRFLLSRLQDKHQPREGEMTQIKDPNVFKTLLIVHQHSK